MDNYEDSCPIISKEVSLSGSVLITTTLLNQPVLESSTYVVKPVDSSLHSRYVFFIKVSAKGGSIGFFGPYILDVGCTEFSFIHIDDESLSTSGTHKWVGDDPNSVYTFLPPKSDKNYCIVKTSIVVELDGSTPHSKLSNCAV